MLCSVCKTETERTYWHRAFPDIYLCEKCWNQPSATDSAVQRSSLARTIWAARKTDRELAKAALNSLRGKGIEQNLSRMRRKSDIVEPDAEG